MTNCAGQVSYADKSVKKTKEKTMKAGICKAVQKWETTKTNTAFTTL